MKKLLLFSLIFSISIGAFSAGLKCQDLFNVGEGILQDSLQSNPFPEKLQKVIGQFTLNTANGTKKIEGSLQELLQTNEDFKSALDDGRHYPYQILGQFKYKGTYADQTLRLVTLNLSQSNRNYNHQEMAALVQVNPKLAAKLGLYKVEGYDNIVLIPDMKTLNQRLSLLAQEYGFDQPIWSYEQAQGVIGFDPYIKMLSEGRFPFSSDADVNLFVHDTLHAVAFSALNSTPAARRIAKMAQVRSKILYKIIERLRQELNVSLFSLESIAKSISSDPMERTMLLTILMTGNYKYFSPSESLALGYKYKVQDKMLTQKRIEELLNLYAKGGKDFKSMYEYISASLNEDQKKMALKIFKQETAQLMWPTDLEIQKAASDILENFFPDSIFDQSSSVPKNTELETGLGWGMSYSTYSSQERPF